MYSSAEATEFNMHLQKNRFAQRLQFQALTSAFLARNWPQYPGVLAGRGLDRRQHQNWPWRIHLAQLVRVSLHAGSRHIRTRSGLLNEIRQPVMIVENGFVRWTIDSNSQYYADNHNTKLGSGSGSSALDCIPTDRVVKAPVLVRHNDWKDDSWDNGQDVYARRNLSSLDVGDGGSSQDRDHLVSKAKLRLINQRTSLSERAISHVGSTGTAHGDIERERESDREREYPSARLFGMLGIPRTWDGPGALGP
ncbi:hypothetical protein LX36DRAFT_676180 [Colletotrichum falcatum]|nr:hypothetical protein LX36DRAFT_676180 [Colletotrichum falcatum]